MTRFVTIAHLVCFVQRSRLYYINCVFQDTRSVDVTNLPEFQNYSVMEMVGDSFATRKAL